MSIGSVIYGLRTRFAHGLRVAYYRDIIRPRILRTRPIESLYDDRCEIHVLTSNADWLNLIWALKSFYLASGRRYRLCIHDDGSLAPAAQQSLRTHFPDARLIDRSTADRDILDALTPFPRCRAFRQTNPLAPKVFDFRHYLESSRMLLFDSDLLFFNKPIELLARIEDSSYRHNSFNSDCGFAYTVKPDVVREMCGFILQERVNSGLGLVHRHSLRYDWAEEFLSMPGITEGHFWRIEQTLYALCSSRFGVQLLPEEYTLRLDGKVGRRCFRHYVGRIRHQMYREGIRLLLRGHFREDLS